ncbi:MAG TPA: helix-turn-helix transcriptional regulator [Mycobacteriales bacterium]|nr:helix-turn-helix transcriptional regulator [Mycobacteriales bacterium]
MTQTADRPTTATAPPSAPELRRRELAAFLRSRRERLGPDEVGLPAGGRRRTPGLRREEVAQLAGVGITWYTWLEQARDIRVSEQVLEAIARTLLLDPHERSHLFTLAGASIAPQESDTQSVTAEVRAVLDKLSPYPAFVTNGRYDLLAYNHAYQVVIGDLDALPFDERNSLWLVFTKETTSRCFVDRDDARARMVAQLRGSMAEHVGEPAWKCLVKRLQAASPDFGDLWKRHDIAVPENATKRILHRDLGLLQFNFMNTWLAPRAGLRLVSYIPLDDATYEATRLFDSMTPGPIT